jgi:hypothetical protein
MYIHFTFHIEDGIRRSGPIRERLLRSFRVVLHIIGLKVTHLSEMRPLIGRCVSQKIQHMGANNS